METTLFHSQFSFRPGERRLIFHVSGPEGQDAPPSNENPSESEMDYEALGLNPDAAPDAVDETLEGNQQEADESVGSALADRQEQGNGAPLTVPVKDDTTVLVSTPSPEPREQEDSDNEEAEDGGDENEQEERENSDNEEAEDRDDENEDTERATEAQPGTVEGNIRVIDNANVNIPKLLTSQAGLRGTLDTVATLLDNARSALNNMRGKTLTAEQQEDFDEGKAQLESVKASVLEAAAGAEAAINADLESVAEQAAALSEGDTEGASRLEAQKVALEGELGKVTALKEKLTVTESNPMDEAMSEMLNARTPGGVVEAFIKGLAALKMLWKKHFGEEKTEGQEDGNEGGEGNGNEGNGPEGRTGDPEGGDNETGSNKPKEGDENAPEGNAIEGEEDMQKNLDAFDGSPDDFREQAEDDLESSLEELDAKIDEAQEELDEVEKKLGKKKDKLTDLRQKLNDPETSDEEREEIQEKVDKLEKKIAKLEEKQQELEDSIDEMLDQQQQLREDHEQDMETLDQMQERADNFAESANELFDGAAEQLREVGGEEAEALAEILDSINFEVDDDLRVSVNEDGLAALTKFAEEAGISLEDLGMNDEGVIEDMEKFLTAITSAMEAVLKSLQEGDNDPEKKENPDGDNDLFGNPEAKEKAEMLQKAVAKIKENLRIINDNIPGTENDYDVTDVVIQGDQILLKCDDPDDIKKLIDFANERNLNPQQTDEGLLVTVTRIDDETGLWGDEIREDLEPDPVDPYGPGEDPDDDGDGVDDGGDDDIDDGNDDDVDDGNDDDIDDGLDQN